MQCLAVRGRAGNADEVDGALGPAAVLAPCPRRLNPDDLKPSAIVGRCPKPAAGLCRRAGESGTICADHAQMLAAVGSKEGANWPLGKDAPSWSLFRTARAAAVRRRLGYSVPGPFPWRQLAAHLKEPEREGHPAKFCKDCGPGRAVLKLLFETP